MEATSTVNFHPGEVSRVMIAEKPNIMINNIAAIVANVLPIIFPFLSWNKETVKQIAIRTIPAPETKI